MRVYKGHHKFVVDNPHRLIGAEIDFGYWPTLTHPRACRLSWNTASHDLYLLNTVTNTIVVLATCDDEQMVRSTLEGWEDAVSQGYASSGAWLMSRVRRFSDYNREFTRYNNCFEEE